jgi:hypothetical protein
MKESGCLQQFIFLYVSLANRIEIVDEHAILTHHDPQLFVVKFR